MKTNLWCVRTASREGRAAKCALLVCSCIALDSCYGQGTTHITFDGSPQVLHGGSSVRPFYTETSGGTSVVFTNFDGHAFLRFGGFSGFPDNGTTYLKPGASSITFFLGDNSLFGVSSVELAGFDSFTRTNFTTLFVGYRSDSSVVSTNFSGSGIEFQTFHFGPEFRDLTRVELPWSGFWSLDNLVIYVPEPSTLLLLSLGGLVLAAARARMRAKQ